jgi:hypothetical protein
VKGIFLFGVVALSAVAASHATANPYKYATVRATSSAATAGLALNFARGQAAALCQSRFRGTLIGIPRSSVLKRGSLFSASVIATCQMPG